MNSAMMGVAVIASILVLYGAFSGRLQGTMITMPMIMVGAGILLAAPAADLFSHTVESSLVERLASATLALVLFTDAARIDLSQLRRHHRTPVRLLALGLPLTIVAGGLMAMLVLQLSFAEAFLIASMLAATDAALGQTVVTDPRVPKRISGALNIESGLNDGIAVPFFLVFLGIASLEESGTSGGLAILAVQKIGWGVAAAIAAAGFVGLIVRFLGRRGWLDGYWKQVVVAACAILAYALAEAVGGSGFIAAYVAGLLFGAIAGRQGQGSTEFGEEAGLLLTALTFLVVGGFMVSEAAPLFSWQVALYAVVSLTFVRMVPVAIALLGTKARAPTVAFIGWFGPRGLASIVFAAIAMEEVLPSGGLVPAVVTWTVIMSVFVHGLTAAPMTARYAAWYSRAAGKRPLMESVNEPRVKSRHPLRPRMLRR